MADQITLKKMYWHSRRGMLELDLILVPFAEGILKSLDDRQLTDYGRLLESEDQDLYQWLVKKVECPDPSLQEIINTIVTGM